MNFLKRSFLITALLGIFLLLTSCGDDGAINTGTSGATTNTTQTAKTVAEKPEESFKKMLEMAEGSDYTVEVILPNRRSLGTNITKYTQKGRSYRVDFVDSPIDGQNWVYEIYNDSKKQVTAVGNYCEWEYQPKLSTGWMAATKEQESHSPVIKSAILKYNGTGYPADSLAEFTQIKKEGNTFSWKLSTYISPSGTNEDVTFILECNGPNGLPTRLIKHVAPYGANSEINEQLCEFRYSNFNSVPESMFDLPSDVLIDQVEAEYCWPTPQWSMFKHNLLEGPHHT